MHKSTLYTWKIKGRVGMIMVGESPTRNTVASTTDPPVQPAGTCHTSPKHEDLKLPFWGGRNERIGISIHSPTSKAAGTPEPLRMDRTRPALEPLERDPRLQPPPPLTSRGFWCLESFSKWVSHCEAGPI